MEVADLHLEFLPTEYSKKIWADRYLQSENDEVFKRVAKAVASKDKKLSLTTEEQEAEFLNLFERGLFIGGGRHLCNMGGTGNNMPGNCFALPIKDSREGIYKTLFEMAEIESKGGGVGVNFCMDPNTKVLTQELTWISLGDLKIGDKIIGLDEYFSDASRHLRPSEVTSTNIVELPSYRITTRKGDMIVSATHPILARKIDSPHKKKGDGYNWIMASDLTDKYELAYASDPWFSNSNSDYLWLGGVLDGEGCLSAPKAKKDRIYNTRLSIGQNKGLVFDNIGRVLDTMGAEYRIVKNKANSCYQYIMASKWDAMKVIAFCPTVRLWPKRETIWNGAKIFSKNRKPVEVLSVEFVGEQKLIAIGTTTKTFIGDGFFQHNSPLRPKGAEVKGSRGKSSGPCAFIDLYNASISTISQGGCLAKGTKLSTTNGEISIDMLANSANFKLLIDEEEYESSAWYSGDKECVTLYFNNERQLTCTLDHPIFTISGVLPAEKCLDKVCYTNEGTAVVYLIEHVGVKSTYDFEEKVNNFGYANSIQVHNSRRGALIAILDVSHPDIEEFIHAKEDNSRWNNLNISVGIHDEFMEAVYNNDSWNLTFNGEVYKTVKAIDLWNQICESAARSGEPGVLFLDTINKDSQLGDAVINTTNPCGEIPLLPYSACNLGSLILPNFFINGKLDKKLLAYAIRLAVLYLDNLLDVSIWPLDKIRETVLDYRILGLGVIGLADLLFLEGIPYGDNSECLEYVDNLIYFIYKTAQETSEELAEELGVFPKYDPNTMDYKPRRNAQLMAMAPTGTISALYGASWGIEPYFSQTMIRDERIGKDVVTYQVLDKYMQDHKELPDYARFAVGDSNTLTVDDHLAVLKIIARNIDGAVSKTVSMPRGSTYEDVDDVYRYLHANDIKGGTVYVEGSRELEAVKAVSEDDIEEEDDIDDCIELVDLIAEPRPRPEVIEGCTYKVKYCFDKPSIYVTINNYEEEPFEIFFSTKDSVIQEWLDMLARTITALFRRGISCDFLVKDFMQYSSSQCGGRFRGKYIQSASAAIGMVLKEHLRSLGIMPKDVDVEGIKKMAKEDSYGLECPECFERTLVKQGGCSSCLSCGFSKCE